MVRISGLRSERFQFLVFLGLSVMEILFTGILTFSHQLSGFQRFFGTINPIAPMVFVSLLGVVLFSYLISRGWFDIYKKENLRGFVYSSVLPTLFVIPAIVLDLVIVLPENLNVLFPESLLFYPAMAYFVEIIFHILPLSLLSILVTSFGKKTSSSRIGWICLAVVALLEPVFQLILGFSSPLPLWAVVYSNGIHVFLINMTQLFIFKRYDFVSMYSFRLVYYVLWHITWGYLRLGLLF